MFDIYPFILKAVNGAALKAPRVFGTSIVKVQEAILREYPEATSFTFTDPQRATRELTLPEGSKDDLGLFWLIDQSTVTG